MKKRNPIIDWLSHFIDNVSSFFAHRKGLLPLTGIGLVLLNLILSFFMPADWFLMRTNFFLHLGVIVGMFGLLLAPVL